MMAHFTVKHIDTDALQAFRRLCHARGLSPNKVLLDFMSRVTPVAGPSDEAILTAELHYPAAASPDARRLG